MLCNASVKYITECVQEWFVLKYCKMGDLSEFQRRQIVGVCLVAASVTKTATSLGISRAAVPKVVTAYTNHGKTSAPERNSG
jgi:hypothetical protein